MDKEYGDSFFEWDLSMEHVRFREFFKRGVRFQTQIKWKDAMQPPLPPEADDELDEWYENRRRNTSRSCCCHP